MIIVISGGSGFLGQALIKHLQETNGIYNGLGIPKNKIINISRRKCNIEGTEDYQIDLADETTLKLALKCINPDIVYHLAAHSTQKEYSGEIIQANCINTFNLVSNLPSHTYINFASSIVVYGNADQPSEFSPVNSTTLYGATKVACEEIIKANYYHKGNPYNIFRLGAMVGPNLTHGLLKDIIAKLESNSPELELWGNSPGSSKVYSHVDDVVPAMVCDRFIPNETVNLCNDNDISVLTVANITMDTLGIRKPIRWDNTKTWGGDNLKLNASNELMRDILQRGFIGSRASIKLAVENYKESR